MASHRKINYKSHMRHHSYDPSHCIDKKKQRQGSQSIQGNYLAQIVKPITTILLNQEDIVNPSGKVLTGKENTFTLPRISNKILGYTPFKYLQPRTMRKQISLFKLKKQSHSLLLPHQEEGGRNNYTFMTHEGGRIKNEDRISIQQFQINSINYQYFAVFDGHGGHLTSTYLANQLHTLIKLALTQDHSPQSALKYSLKTIEEKLKRNPRLSHKSGSCALVCLLSGSDCWVANVGDSRMISITATQQTNQITRDHKPQDEEERKRIQYNGGEVYRNSSTIQHDSPIKKPPFRVYPGKLSISRAIGDIFIKKQNPNIVISDPEIYHLSTNNLSHLLLFSDGLYETLSNNQISQYFLSHKLEKAGRELFEEAFHRNSQDNRSLIAIQFL